MDTIIVWILHLLCIFLEKKYQKNIINLEKILFFTRYKIFRKKGNFFEMVTFKFHLNLKNRKVKKVILSYFKNETSVNDLKKSKKNIKEL